MKVSILASGSSGNSVFIKTQDTSILVDAGLSGKAIEEKMGTIGEKCEDLSAILVTHEHSDHIKGVGILSRRYDLPVFATSDTWESLQFSIGEVSEANIKYVEKNKGFDIGSLKVESFSTSHDAVDPLGFGFFEQEFKLGLVTDTGCITSNIIKKVQGSDCLIMESNHDVEMVQQGKYPAHLKKRILSKRGHLSNVVTGHCLASLISGQTKSVILAHLSEENNHPSLAHTTVSKILADNGLIDGRDINLSVASRYEPLDVW